MSKIAHLKFNDPAPDLELETAEGGKIQLSSLWEGKTLLLAFTRHFGCPQCKEMLDQLVISREELAEKGLALAVITQAPSDAARAFCDQYAPGVLCLADPERKAYAAYGLGRGGLTQTVFSTRVLRSNARLRRSRGWKAELPPPGQDAMLMSGTFIIGSDGRIRLPYYYDNIADHPPVELLLRGVMGMDWQVPFESPIQPKG
ncbi:MAG: AhpC/TSA family protein [Anaerolineales bacterium]|nr:AhpC/TSA family protein [Anaerolineales bacterium]